MVVDKTSWFRITAFNPSEYTKGRVKKGALVFVDGDISIDKWLDEASGKTLHSVRIVQGRISHSSFRKLLMCVGRVSVLRNPRPQEEPEASEESASGSA